MNYSMGKENKCKGVVERGGKTYCAYGGGHLAHRCAVVAELTPFRCCGGTHAKRGCSLAVYKQ